MPGGMANLAGRDCRSVTAVTCERASLEFTDRFLLRAGVFSQPQHVHNLILRLSTAQRDNITKVFNTGGALNGAPAIVWGLSNPLVCALRLTAHIVNFA